MNMDIITGKRKQEIKDELLKERSRKNSPIKTSPDKINEKQIESMEEKEIEVLLYDSNEGD